MDTFTHDGREYRVTHEHDVDIGPPWEHDCGHGPVSDWRHHAFGQGTKPPKAPGEMILLWDRGAYRTYNFAEACRIARRDGWCDIEKLPGYLGRDLRKMFPGDTPRARAARAAYADFDRLRRWCNDFWHYIGVTVEMLDDEGEPTGETASLLGVESDAGEFLDEVARELADEIAWRIDAAARDAAETQAVRASMIDAHSV